MEISKLFDENIAYGDKQKIETNEQKEPVSDFMQNMFDVPANVGVEQKNNNKIINNVSNQSTPIKRNKALNNMLHRIQTRNMANIQKSNKKDGIINGQSAFNHKSTPFSNEEDIAENNFSLQQFSSNFQLHNNSNLPINHNLNNNNQNKKQIGHQFNQINNRQTEEELGFNQLRLKQSINGVNNNNLNYSNKKSMNFSSNHNEYSYNENNSDKKPIFDAENYLNSKYLNNKDANQSFTSEFRNTFNDNVVPPPPKLPPQTNYQNFSNNLENKYNINQKNSLFKNNQLNSSGINLKDIGFTSPKKLHFPSNLKSSLNENRRFDNNGQQIPHNNINSNPINRYENQNKHQNSIFNNQINLNNNLDGDNQSFFNGNPSSIQKTNSKINLDNNGFSLNRQANENQNNNFNDIKFNSQNSSPSISRDNIDSEIEKLVYEQNLLEQQQGMWENRPNYNENSKDLFDFNRKNLNFTLYNRSQREDMPVSDFQKPKEKKNWEPELNPEERNEIIIDQLQYLGKFEPVKRQIIEMLMKGESLPDCQILRNLKKAGRYMGGVTLGMAFYNMIEVFGEDMIHKEYSYGSYVYQFSKRFRELCRKVYKKK